jgi:NTP pyrophosphatase (non-canonical NTP hydrolase)
MENSIILAKAIQKYGADAQQKQCIEECSELITAILHHQRGKCTAQDVVTEIADVTIMCEQMKLMFGAAEVEREIKAKIERLTESLGYVVGNNI